MEDSQDNTSASLRHRQVKAGDADIHVVEGGSPTAPVVLFLHGYPQNWFAFQKIMNLACKQAHVVAIDLPGIGGSKAPTPPGDKQGIAGYVRGAIQALGLKDVTLVGHDAGGMVAFAYLTTYINELSRLVIMDTVIPGIDPWDNVVKNPYIWHFRFNSIPELPEKLVQGRQDDFFAYYFDTISAHPEAIGKEARQQYSEAYAEPVALSTGFNWYRTFEQDAKLNAEFASSDRQIETPVLYLRGEREGGDIKQYIEGFQKVGLTKVEPGIIPDSGHYAPEENPEGAWNLIARFMQLS